MEGFGVGWILCYEFGGVEDCFDGELVGGFVI